MPLLTIVIVVLGAGVILWLANTYIPMQRTIDFHNTENIGIGNSLEEPDKNSAWIFHLRGQTGKRNNNNEYLSYTQLRN